ncbi:MAG TPA: glycosyltransferase [Mycobacteriales bacterium]|nr:glycosyltransferase [Mycobacteriales bacterium]
MPANPSPTTVLHYVDRWLELSAGFVHAHVRHSRHRAVVVSREPLINAATFPHRPVHTLAPLLRVATPVLSRPRLLTAGLAAAALAHRARVVHVHFGYAVDDVVGAVRRLRLPLVVSLHGHDATAVPRENPRHYEKATQLASAVVVPSRYFRDIAESLGFPGGRIHVIPAGVDTTFFTPTPLPDAPVVSFVGRLVEKKGVDVLAKAWPAVREAVPGVRLEVLGEGPLADLLPQDVLREAPDPARRAEQVRDALRRARVVVTPSRAGPDGDSESLLLVNLEAQASGRPVVTTNHGGIPEYVDSGRTALVVPENSPAELARSLVSVLLDHDIARRLAAAGPVWARDFDVRGCTSRVDDLYDDLV